MSRLSDILVSLGICLWWVLFAWIVASLTQQKKGNSIVPQRQSHRLLLRQQTSISQARINNNIT